MKELGRYSIECNNREQLIPLEEIVAIELFDSIDEIKMFFFSFDGEYYGTNIAFIKYMNDLYTGMLDELNINHLFYA